MGDPTRVVGRRVIAYVLDSILVAVIFVGVAAALGVEVTADPVNPAQQSLQGSNGAILMTAAVPLLYVVLVNVVLQGITGVTPGRALVSIRLVGWDGRPPGLWRAFLHTLVVQVAAAFSCLGGGLLLAFVLLNKAHRHPGDMLANTYVVDSPAMGRLIVRTAEGVRVGPPAVRREDVVAELGAEEAARILAPTNMKRSTEPQFDKQRGTYVVWRPKQQQWLEFDDATRQWRELH